MAENSLYPQPLLPLARLLLLASERLHGINAERCETLVVPRTVNTLGLLTRGDTLAGRWTGYHAAWRWLKR